MLPVTHATALTDFVIIYESLNRIKLIQHINIMEEKISTHRLGENMVFKHFDCVLSALVGVSVSIETGSIWGQIHKGT